jgi:hypothetical protein
VDASGRFAGLLTREGVEDVPEHLRAGSTVDEVSVHDGDGIYRVSVEEPLEAVLTSEGIQRFGALAAVDGDGVLRGVVTVDQVRRALRGPAFT